MPLPEYTTVTDLRSELSPSADDINQNDRLTRAVTDASRAVDMFCHMEPGAFAPLALIKTFDVLRPNNQRFMLDQRITDNTRLISMIGLRVPPLISVTTLKTDDNSDGVYETTWTAGTDYRLYPLNDEVKREIRPNPDIGRYAFPIGQARVQINGSWGFIEDGATPEAIRRVTLLLAMNYYRRPIQSASAASQGIGGAAVKFGYLDPDVATLLWSVAGRYREQFVAA